MSGAYTPGTVPTAPYGWNQQTSVPPASPFTPQPECKFLFTKIMILYYFIILFDYSCESSI